VIRGLFSSLHLPVAFVAAFYQIHDLAEGKERFVEEMIMRIFWELKRSRIFFFLKKSIFQILTNMWRKGTLIPAKV